MSEMMEKKKEFNEAMNHLIGQLKLAVALAPDNRGEIFRILNATSSACDAWKEVAHNDWNV